MHQNAVARLELCPAAAIGAGCGPLSPLPFGLAGTGRLSASLVGHPDAPLPGCPTTLQIGGEAANAAGGVYRVHGAVLIVPGRAGFPLPNGCSVVASEIRVQPVP